MFQRRPVTPSTLYIASFTAATLGLRSLADGDLATARRKMEEAQALDMQVFHSRQPLGESILTQASAWPIDAGLAHCRQAVVELLPPTRAMRALGPWLASRLHMRVVFTAAGRGNYPLAAKHLWPGVRNDPSWLLNRGVLAIILRTLAARQRPDDGRKARSQ